MKAIAFKTMHAVKHKLRTPTGSSDNNSRMSYISNDRSVLIGRSNSLIPPSMNLFSSMKNPIVPPQMGVFSTRQPCFTYIHPLSVNNAFLQRLRSADPGLKGIFGPISRSPLIQEDNIMHATEIGQQLMPLLILGIAAIYSTKTGDATVVFDPLGLMDVTHESSLVLEDVAHGSNLGLVDVRQGEEPPETTVTGRVLNKRKAILLGCWLIYTLAITAAAINK